MFDSSWDIEIRAPKPPPPPMPTRAPPKPSKRASQSKALLPILLDSKQDISLFDAFSRSILDDKSREEAADQIPLSVLAAPSKKADPRGKSSRVREEPKQSKLTGSALSKLNFMNQSRQTPGTAPRSLRSEPRAAGGHHSKAVTSRSDLSVGSREGASDHYPRSGSQVGTSGSSQGVFQTPRVGFKSRSDISVGDGDRRQQYPNNGSSNSRSMQQKWRERSNNSIISTTSDPSDPSKGGRYITKPAPRGPSSKTVNANNQHADPAYARGSKQQVPGPSHQNSSYNRQTHSSNRSRPEVMSMSSQKPRNSSSGNGASRPPGDRPWSDYKQPRRAPPAPAPAVPPTPKTGSFFGRFFK
jgi:hypothetical protein